MDTEQHTSSSPPEQQQQPLSTEQQPQSSSFTSSSSHHLQQDQSSGSSSSGYQNIEDKKPVTARAIWELFDWNNEWLFQVLEDSNWDRHTEAAASYADLRARVEEFHQTTTETQARTDTAIKELKASLAALGSGQDNQFASILQALKDLQT